MSIKKAIVLLIVLVMIATMAISCGKSGTAEVTIGLTAPLSGGGAQYGTDVQRGIEMAISDINEEGGVKINGERITMKLQS